MSQSDKKNQFFIDENLLNSLLGDRPAPPAEPAGQPEATPKPVMARPAAPTPAAPAARTTSAIPPASSQQRQATKIREVECKNPEETLRVFEALLLEKPEQAQAMFGKAVMCQLLGRDDEALDVYERLLAKGEESAALLANMITLSARRGEWEQAEVCARRLLDVDPGSTQALEALASAALARCEWRTASEHATELARKEPTSFEAWFNLGVSLQRLGLRDDAIAAFNEALELRPASAEAHAALAMLHEANKQPDLAAQELSRLAKMDPRAPAVLWRDALEAERRKEPARAEECYQKVLAAEPDVPEAWLRYGCLRFECSDFKGARECFQRVMTAHPEWVEAQLNYGLCCWKLGDPEAAIAALGKVLAREPGAIDALRALAAIHLERHDYREALDLQARLGDLGQPIWALSYNLGLLHQHAGENEAAAHCYQKALQENPGFTEALVNLGQALKGLGREEEARFCLEEAAKAAGNR
jgi:tetratricopeptide (TPR) repeat protein